MERDFSPVVGQFLPSGFPTAFPGLGLVTVAITALEESAFLVFVLFAHWLFSLAFQR